jgi:hypothetical protein
LLKKALRVAVRIFKLSSTRIDCQTVPKNGCWASIAISLAVRHPKAKTSQGKYARLATAADKASIEALRIQDCRRYGTLHALA